MNEEYEETPEIDYSIEYADYIREATLEMADKPAKPTGSPLPASIIQAIVDGRPGIVLARLNRFPAGTVNDRAGGLTPLHISAMLYAHQRHMHRSLEAVKYDTICRILMLNGADPLARAYRHNDSTPYYPAEFADGLTPPSLRRRMLLEAAEDHLGWRPELTMSRLRQATQATIQRRRRADTLRGQPNLKRQAIAGGIS